MRILREGLRNIILEKGIVRSSNITLSSGSTSGVYFNLRPVVMDQVGSFLIYDQIMDMIERESFASIGGPAIGAIPIVQAVSAIGNQHAVYFRSFFVRGRPKGHGVDTAIEGNFMDGDRVIMVDDVTTTGASILSAVREVRARGATVQKAISIVDREEGAVKALRNNGIELLPIFKKSDLV